jgi:hypothetical protein
MFFFWHRGKKEAKVSSIVTPGNGQPSETQILSKEAMEAAEELYRLKEEVRKKSQDVKQKSDTCIRKLAERKKV